MSRGILVSLRGAQSQEQWGLVREEWQNYAIRCRATLVEHETVVLPGPLPTRLAAVDLARELGLEEFLSIDPWIRVNPHAPAVFDSGRLPAAVLDGGMTREGVWLASSRADGEEPEGAGRIRPLDPRFNVSWKSERWLRFPFLLACPGHSHTGRCVGLALEGAYFLNFGGAEGDLSVRPRKAPSRPARAEAPAGAAVARSSAAPAAVTLILYNRPDLTRKVFEAIRKERPAKLFLIADGPDKARTADQELCVQARQCLEVDWKCEVWRDFSSEHQGARLRVETGLRAVFERADEAIILEDDIVPSAQFFRFCQDLLERYRDDERVLSVGGTAIHFGVLDAGGSYAFSRYPTSWGWATWKRAFGKYDTERRHPAGFPDTLSWLRHHLESETAATYWAHLFEPPSPRRPTWDCVWTRSGFLGDGLHAMPMRNLVSNLGFRGDATHTRNPSVFSCLPPEPLDFPLECQPVERCAELDQFLEETIYSGTLARALQRIRSRVRGRRSGERP